MTKPPRKRFQIHLSTAIVMMFVAGGLMWANFRIRIGEAPAGYVASFPVCISANYGWPITCLQRARDLRFYDGVYGGYNEDMMPKVSYGIVAINTTFGLFIEFLTWFISEWLIRRRAAEKGA